MEGSDAMIAIGVTSEGADIGGNQISMAAPRTPRRPTAGDGPDEELRTTRRQSSDRLRRQQARDARLRRTLIFITIVLLVGAALARWREDPATVLAAGVDPVAGQSRVLGVDREQPGASPSAGASVKVLPAPVPSGIDPGGSGAVEPHADSEDAPAPTLASGPSPAAVPASGAGTLSQVQIPAGSVKAQGRTVTYGIDIEDGLPVAAADFAAVVQRVLVDERGWQTEDQVRFVPVSPAERAAGAHVDIRVTLASPTLTATLCAPLNTTLQQVSCWNGMRAVLNLTRWMRGAPTYGSDLATYREYLVSHEVGHGLGHSHEHCPAPGKPAPVMVQQTKDLEGCTAWPWPTGP